MHDSDTEDGHGERSDGGPGRRGGSLALSKGFLELGRLDAKGQFSRNFSGGFDTDGVLRGTKGERSWHGDGRVSNPSLRDMHENQEGVVMARAGTLSYWVRRPKANLGQTTTRETLKGRGMDRTQLFERKPKESLNGEPPGAGLHSIYTTIHEGCTRLSVGLCTVHDIIVELRARLYDIRGGSVHSTRHRSRLL